MKSKKILAGMSLALVLGGTMLATGCTAGTETVGSGIDINQEVLDSTLDNLNSYLQDMKDSNETNKEKLNNDSDYAKETLLNLLLNQFVSSTTEYSPKSVTIEYDYYEFGLNLAADEDSEDSVRSASTNDSAKDSLPSPFETIVSTTYKYVFEDNTFKFLIEDEYYDYGDYTNAIRKYYYESKIGDNSYSEYCYESYVDKDGVTHESKELYNIKNSNIHNILCVVGDVAYEYRLLLQLISEYDYFVRTVNGNETTYICTNLENFGISTTSSDGFEHYYYLKIVFVDGKLDMTEYGNCNCQLGYDYSQVTIKKYDFENVVIDFDKTGYTEATETE